MVSVAPRRGAWVETRPGGSWAYHLSGSHPAGVRGLKPLWIVPSLPGLEVAPRRGAWVETAIQTEKLGLCYNSGHDDKIVL